MHAWLWLWRARVLGLLTPPLAHSHLVHPADGAGAWDDLSLQEPRRAPRVEQEVKAPVGEERPPDLKQSEGTRNRRRTAPPARWTEHGTPPQETVTETYNGREPQTSFHPLVPAAP